MRAARLTSVLARHSESDKPMTTMAHDELAKLPVSEPSTTHWRATGLRCTGLESSQHSHAPGDDADSHRRTDRWWRRLLAHAPSCRLPLRSKTPRRCIVYRNAGTEYRRPILHLDARNQGYSQSNGCAPNRMGVLRQSVEMGRALRSAIALHAGSSGGRLRSPSKIPISRAKNAREMAHPEFSFPLVGVGP
jgi:hypothetical protein